MRATGPIHPARDDGSVLEATFELSQVPVFDLVFHHKAGARDSVRSVNADYHEALETLLARLASIRATILGIAVDSSIAQELEPDDRELQLAFPIALWADTDTLSLRLEITRAQKSIARRRDAKPGGGNDQKRIRLSLTVPDAAGDFHTLVKVLLGPRPEGGSMPQGR